MEDKLSLKALGLAYKAGLGNKGRKFAVTHGRLAHAKRFDLGPSRGAFAIGLDHWVIGTNQARSTKNVT